MAKTKRCKYCKTGKLKYVGTQPAYKSINTKDGGLDFVPSKKKCLELWDCTNCKATNSKFINL